MSADWFSAMLRFVILIEGEGATGISRSLILVRAQGWDEAREAVLVQGRQMESEYVGGEGARVRWRLEEIETIDQIGDEIAHGREVYAEPMDLPSGVTHPFEAVFSPEASQPGQSGV